MKRVPEEYLPPKKYLPEFKFSLPEIQYPPMLNIPELFIDENIEKGRGNKVAIFYQNAEITYTELQNMVDKLGNALRDLGIQSGDRVMIRLPNIPEFLVSYLAIQKIGAITAPTMILLKARELAFIENKIKPKAIIVSSELTGEIEKAGRQFETIMHVIVVDGKLNELRREGYLSYEKILRKGSNKLEAVKVDKDDVALILHTSGTTGLPKSVIHTPSGILGSSDAFSKYCLEIQEDDVIGGPPSMAFAYGNKGLITVPLRNGISSSLLSKFTPTKMFETIEKHGITILFNVPTAYRMMLDSHLQTEHKYNLDSLRIFVSAGETLRAGLYHGLKKSFPRVEILEHIGCTESYGAICSSRPGKVRAGSMGIEAPGFEVKILDDEGKECPPGVHGHFAFRGPSGFRYWKDPDKQKECVKNGWNYTGDVAYKDENGFFWYISRSDDIIKSAAYRISPIEVETVMNEHQAVRESAVIGVPDPVRGQKVKAFIIVQDGYMPSKELEEELINHVKNEVAPYKAPQEVEFVSSLPRTETGKLRRTELRELQH